MSKSYNFRDFSGNYFFFFWRNWNSSSINLKVFLSEKKDDRRLQTEVHRRIRLQIGSREHRTTNGRFSLISSPVRDPPSRIIQRGTSWNDLRWPFLYSETVKVVTTPPPDMFPDLLSSLANNFQHLYYHYHMVYKNFLQVLYNPLFISSKPSYTNIKIQF